MAVVVVVVVVAVVVVVFQQFRHFLLEVIIQDDPGIQLLNMS